MLQNTRTNSKMPTDYKERDDQRENKKQKKRGKSQYLAEFSVQVLGIHVASGVDTKFPYRVRIVDRGLIAAALFADTVFDSHIESTFPGRVRGRGGARHLLAHKCLHHTRGHTPMIVPRTNICFIAPWSKFLERLPPAPLPPVQTRGEQHKFL